MLSEDRILVSAEVEVFVAQSPGPHDRTLLVIHGGLAGTTVRVVASGIGWGAASRIV